MVHDEEVIDYMFNDVLFLLYRLDIVLGINVSNEELYFISEVFKLDKGYMIMGQII